MLVCYCTTHWCGEVTSKGMLSTAPDGKEIRSPLKVFKGNNCSTDLQESHQPPKSTIRNRPSRRWGWPASCKGPILADTRWTILQRQTRSSRRFAQFQPAQRCTFVIGGFERIWTVVDRPPHVFLCKPFHRMYPYSSRQVTTWERLLAIADPLQTKMTHLFICLVTLALDASRRLCERCTLYLMPSVRIDCWSRLPPQSDVCPAATRSTARCCWCALHWLRLWAKYKKINTLLWLCLCFFWSLIA